MALDRIPCPNCGRLTGAGPDNPWRPFCGHRCKLIDLGEWLDEAHRIPDEETEPGYTPPDASVDRT